MMRTIDHHAETIDKTMELMDTCISIKYAHKLMGSYPSTYRTLNELKGVAMECGDNMLNSTALHKIVTQLNAMYNPQPMPDGLDAEGKVNFALESVDKHGSGLIKWVKKRVEKLLKSGGAIGELHGMSTSDIIKAMESLSDDFEVEVKGKSVLVGLSTNGKVDVGESIKCLNKNFGYEELLRTVDNISSVNGYDVATLNKQKEASREIRTDGHVVPDYEDLVIIKVWALAGEVYIVSLAEPDNKKESVCLDTIIASPSDYNVKLTKKELIDLAKAYKKGSDFMADRSRSLIKNYKDYDDICKRCAALRKRYRNLTQAEEKELEQLAEKESYYENVLTATYSSMTRILMAAKFVFETVLSKQGK